MQYKYMIESFEFFTLLILLCTIPLNTPNICLMYIIRQLYLNIKLNTYFHTEYTVPPGESPFTIRVILLL